MPRQPPELESNGSQQEHVFIVFVWGLCMYSYVSRRKKTSSTGHVGILLLNLSPALSAEEPWDRFENQATDRSIPDQADDAFSFKAGSNLPSIDGRFEGLRVNFGIDNPRNEDHRQHLSVLKLPGRDVMTIASCKC